MPTARAGWGKEEKKGGAYYAPLLPPAWRPMYAVTTMNSTARGINPQMAAVPASQRVVLVAKKLSIAPGRTALAK